MRLSRKLYAAALTALLSVGVCASAWAADLTVETKEIREDAVSVSMPMFVGSADRAMDMRLTQLATHRAVRALYQYLPTEGTELSARDYVEFTNRSDDPIAEGYSLVRASANLISDGFRQEEATRRGAGEPYYVNVEYTVHSATERVVSIEQTTTSYTGGAHANTVVDTMNVHTDSALAIALTDLFTDGSDWQSRLEYMIAIQQKGKNRLLAHTGQAEIAYQPRAVRGNEHFYIDSSTDHHGLTIVYNPGEIAPMSAGVQEFFFPVTMLGDILNYDL